MTDLSNDSWNTTIQKLDMTRDARDFWKTVTRLMGNSRQKQTINLKDNHNNNIDSDEDIERIFRHYWQKVFTITDEDNDDFDTDTDETVTTETIRQLPNWDPLMTVNYNDIPDNLIVTDQEVKDVIRQSKQSAPGQTGITRLHLQHLPDNLIDSLTNIFNALLVTGYFPQQWKIAIMVFLLKAFKSPHHHTNYRPISLLETIGKLYERLLNRRTYDAMTDLDLHNTRQHGFRKRRGTQTAIATLTEIISKQKTKQRQKINLVLRDLSKAFDRVWHSGLLYKLHISNFPISLLRSINSFLSNRIAHIRINSFVGPQINIFCGVPQGSCLSPTLFNFFCKYPFSTFIETTFHASFFFESDRYSVK